MPITERIDTGSIAGLLFPVENFKAETDGDTSDRIP